jgi:hypothetical protein
MYGPVQTTSRKGDTICLGKKICTLDTYGTWGNITWNTLYSKRKGKFTFYNDECQHLCFTTLICINESFTSIWILQEGNQILHLTYGGVFNRNRTFQFACSLLRNYNIIINLSRDATMSSSTTVRGMQLKQPWSLQFYDGRFWVS